MKKVLIGAGLVLGVLGLATVGAGWALKNFTINFDSFHNELMKQEEE